MNPISRGGTIYETAKQDLEFTTAKSDTNAVSKVLENARRYIEDIIHGRAETIR
jgi:hypothetical protein